MGIQKIFFFLCLALAACQAPVPTVAVTRTGVQPDAPTARPTATATRSSG